MQLPVVRVWCTGALGAVHRYIRRLARIPRLCVISLFLRVHLGLGQVNIHPYIFGDMSVARTRRSALVFVRTVSAVVDYFFVFGVS